MTEDELEVRTGTCSDCGEEFEVESSRGKIPKLCEKCKLDKKSRLRQASRIERQTKKQKKSYASRRFVKKKKLTLTIDGDLLNEAKDVNLNISSFLEDKLGEKFGYEKHEMWEKK
jgi:post-segregation antitoxin (ccd killing protein)